MFGSAVEEFRQRYSGRYFGKYRGIVKEVATDERKLHRIKLIAPVVAGEEILGWAWPAPMMGGGLNNGAPWPPGIGDYVWVEFEEGDPSRPIWMPGPWGMIDGENSTPKQSRGEFDDEDVLIRDQGIIPPSSFQGTYSNVRQIGSKSGHHLQFDDTPGAERVQLFHRSGTRIEMTSEGSLQEVIAATHRRRISANAYDEIAGNLNQDIGGNRVLRVKGVNTETYEQDMVRTYNSIIETGRSVSQEWAGDFTTLVGGQWDLSVGSQASIQTGGQLALMVGQNMQTTVMETLELAASNATGLPTSRTILLQGYNGHVELLATDITGLVPTAAAHLVLDPTLGKVALGVGDTVGGGLIELLNTPLAHIHLGGVGVTEPFILGNQLALMLATILTDLATHVHPTGVGPSAPPVTSALYLAQAALVPSLLSLKILGA